MFLVPHMAEDAPMAAADGEASAETTPVFAQHFAPLEVVKAAVGGAKLRAPTGRLSAGGAKGAPRLGVRAEASRKIAFTDDPSAAGALVAAANAALAQRLPNAFDAFPGAAAAALPAPWDVPMFLSHSHALQRVPAKAAPAALPAPSPLVKRLLAPSRDRLIVAVSVVWRGGGDVVSLLGCFTGWRERVPMVADGSGAHFVTVHLRAGEYRYVFEVNGRLCVADDEPMADACGAGAPVPAANVLLVDDGAEFDGEERAEALSRADDPLGAAPWLARASDAAADGCYTQSTPTAALGLWVPQLPPHLAKLHGVRAAPLSLRRAPRAGQPPVEWHSELGHVAFALTAAPPRAKFGEAQGEMSEDDNYADSTSDDQSMPSAPGSRHGTPLEPAPRAPPPASRAPAAPAAAACISVTNRWRAHARVTSILYTRAPAAAPPSARDGSTVDSGVSAPIRIPATGGAPAARKSAAPAVDAPPPQLSMAAAAIAATRNPRLLVSRAYSDVSMGRPPSPPSSPATKAPEPCGGGGVSGGGGGLWFDQGYMSLGDDKEGPGADVPLSFLLPTGTGDVAAKPPFAPFGWMVADLSAALR